HALKACAANDATPDFALGDLGADAPRLDELEVAQGQARGHGGARDVPFVAGKDDLHVATLEVGDDAFPRRGKRELIVELECMARSRIAALIGFVCLSGPKHVMVRRNHASLLLKGIVRPDELSMTKRP